MATIGTAHVKIKPVLDEEALERIAVRIEEAIERAVTRALENAGARVPTTVNVYGPSDPQSARETAKRISGSL